MKKFKAAAAAATCKRFCLLDMRRGAVAHVKALFQYQDQDRMEVHSGNSARESQVNLNKWEPPGLAIYKLFEMLTSVFIMTLCSNKKLLAHMKWCYLVFRTSMF